jgi:formiminotetrahydrofolate cyclodeaminase
MLTSGRGGGGAAFAFFLGCISIVITITRTKAESVTEKLNIQGDRKRKIQRTNSLSHVVPFDFLNVCTQVANIHNSFIEKLLLEMVEDAE